MEVIIYDETYENIRELYQPLLDLSIFQLSPDGVLVSDLTWDDLAEALPNHISGHGVVVGRGDQTILFYRGHALRISTKSSDRTLTLEELPSWLDSNEVTPFDGKMIVVCMVFITLTALKLLIG